MESDQMEEKNRLIPADEKELQDPENLIKNTEADTEGIVDFMHEEIKKRPMNRRKLLRRARETSLIAILFGTVSCIVFAILLPVINNILYPSENTAQTVMLPEENPYEELTPEDMVENERKLEAKEEKEWIREELQGILDEKIIGVEQQKRISSALQELASESSGMIAAVSGISSDMDWFNDAYENKNTVSGLVTKKSAEGIFILVQSRRISDAQRIMVTFKDGTEAEARIAGTDEVTGLTMLNVPLVSVPVGGRALIREAKMGSSVGPIITGAPVIAIGSPTGTTGSVTYGNVTGADNSLDILDNDLCLLTTDIYGSGDATGFLINLDGEVIGMIDMRYRDNSVPNMLCAVGISELRPVIRRMEAGRTKAFLGINGIDVTPEISKANDIPTGVWVKNVEDDSPAMAAGIQKGDVITGFGKTEILHMAGLIVQLENAEPGQNVILHIMRRNGGSFEEVQVPVSLQ
ncbi:MAG: serine protease [Sarcina sp.]|jgi:S1-C subfamily serine protease|nr:serine protease [Sarcina sp.]